MKTRVVSIFVIFLSISVFAQVDLAKIDSLSSLASTQKGQQRIETLIHLSEAYRKISVEKSFETDSAAIDYAEREGIENMRGIIFISMGKSASLSGDFPLALNYLNKAVEALKQTKNFADLCKAYNQTGMVLKDMAEYDKAIQQFDLASEIAKQHELSDLYATSAISRATVYFSKGEYDKAADFYLEARQIYKELNDSLLFAITTMNVGLVYWQWNKAELAKEMLLEAKEVFERKNQFANLGRILNNLGKIYYQDFNDTTKALDYYQQSLAIREKIGHQLGMAVVLANIGNIYTDKNQFDVAFNNYHQSLNISESIGYKEGMALANYYLGMAHYKKKNFSESIEYLDASLRLAKEHGLNAYLSLINKAKMGNYVALNDYEGFAKEFKIFSDELDSLKANLADMEFSIAQAKKMTDDAKAELESANETLAIQQKQLRWYQIFLALFVVISLVLGYKKYFNRQ